MKKFAALLALVLLLMFGSIGIVGAQDNTPAAEEQPAATVEPGDTAIVVSDGGQTTTVTLPASDTEADTGGIGNVERAFYWGMIALPWSLVALLVIRYGAAVRDLVSPQTMRAIYNDALVFSNKLTAAIPGELDDSFKTILAGMLDEQLKKWEVEQTQITNKAVANALEKMSNPG